MNKMTRPGRDRRTTTLLLTASARRLSGLRFEPGESSSSR
jgi:hypothetical protein